MQLRSADTKSLGQVSDADTLLSQGSHFAYLISGESLTSAGIGSRSKSSLGFAVADVVQLRAKEQVIWIDASPNVAAMQNTECAGILPAKDSIGKTVGFVGFAGDIDRAVTASVNGTTPNPTAIGLLVDLGHEPTEDVGIGQQFLKGSSVADVTNAESAGATHDAHGAFAAAALRTNERGGYTAHVNLLNRLAVPGLLAAAPGVSVSNYTADWAESWT